MEIKLDAQNRVTGNETETYAAFRSYIPKPLHEDAHLRHIFRFYMARAMQKRGAEEIYILPKLDVKGKIFQVDVAAVSASKYTISICEAESVTSETEEILETLRDLDGIEVIIVHSRYGQDGNIISKFKEQFETKKFHLLAVVPPPFDDVYEYDIWMFETTFRNVYEGNNS